MERPAAAEISQTRTLQDAVLAFNVLGLAHLSLERAHPLELVGPLAVDHADPDPELLHRMIPP